MKKSIGLLLLLFSATMLMANLPDDKVKKKTQSKSSCCSYDEFARKNKRTKKPSPANNTGSSHPIK